MQQTPTSKTVGKRSADSFECSQNDEYGTQTSSTKIQKFVEVKREAID